MVLAKELATLDHLSGGRVELGIGVGWFREEFDALGVPWERRGARTDEYVAAMRPCGRAMARASTVSSRRFRVSSNPKPAQGMIPIVVGGHSRAAAERAGRLGDGFVPGKGSPAELAEMIDIVRQTAAAHDRDPSTIEITAGSPGVFGDDPIGAAQELASLGVSRIMVPAFTLMKGDAMAAFAERVVRPAATV